MINIKNYSTLLFDCDGVVLDSNRMKTEAFHSAALPWGVNAAEALVGHHVANGGISRHRKFAHFLDAILPEHCPGAVPGVDGPGLDELLASYAQAVRGGLMTCSVTEGLEALRAKTAHANWCIVSGGDQAELREIFAARGLDHFFNGGIFGSPDNKDSILAREMACGTIKKPALFLGDSRYDYEAAQRAGFDFVFVSGWSELREWERFVKYNKLESVNVAGDLLFVADKTRR
ncbi:HAD family hydrolase [Synechococcus sp. CB0205]|uniref:HAD family hydrolase n=1 Tax=Synechococcus sp. CB0205 TaxID=232363 RepID=UPI0002002D69|nr:HAD-IA family hydrolase [Synechococcus sp. CB0205]